MQWCHLVTPSIQGWGALGVCSERWWGAELGLDGQSRPDSPGVEGWVLHHMQELPGQEQHPEVLVKTRGH